MGNNIRTDKATEFFAPKPLRQVFGEHMVELMEAKKRIYDSFKPGAELEDHEALNQCEAIADIMIENTIAFYNK